MGSAGSVHKMGPRAAGMLVVGGSKKGEDEERVMYNYQHQ